MMTKIILTLIFIMGSASASFAATVTEEGVWCWFADPRAMNYRTPDGRVNMTYVGYIDTHGNIKAMQYDFNRNRQTEVLVRSYFQPDDHDNPTFLALPDRRIMVIYSRHTDERCFYYRISTLPADITTLGPEHVIPTENNTTYPSPFILSGDPDHIYLCWRGINWHPTVARLSLPDDNGEVKVVDGPYQIVQSSGARPYAKYVSNGKDKIYLTFTTGHPDNESPNFLYFNYIDIHNFTFHDITGRQLSNVREAPFKVDKTNEFVENYSEMVVDNSPYRDWVCQVILDNRELPTIAMTRISHDKKSHNYYLAKWGGKEWNKHFIAHGGGHFHQSDNIERCYSGGMALDAFNPGDVYCSVPVEGRNGRVYEIVKYSVDHNGVVTGMMPVTSNSNKNNIRPYCLNVDNDNPLRLMWMNGDYYDWIVSRERPRGYCTSIQSDFKGFSKEMFGLSESESLPQVSMPYKFEPHKDFVLPVRVNTKGVNKKGVLIDLGTLSYSIDTVSMIPEIRYKKKVYKSANRLATADSWRQQKRGTSGQWYEPVKLDTVNLTISYSDGELTTFINGLVDQRIRIAEGKNVKNVFEIVNPDYNLSPMTGMTRKHWIAAAKYILEGAFSHIQDIDDVMYFPKQLDKTYPRNENVVKVAKLEGLARTLFIATPLLVEDPGLTLNGIKVADYYRYQILSLLDGDSQYGVQPHPRGPSQTLLELGSICLSLEVAKDVLWNIFTKEQQQALAILFRNYGEGPTIGSNWQFFNTFILSFLKENGYEINEEYLTKNLTRLLDLYKGEGWYSDAPAYDYYSMWAFQTYGPLWAHLFGKRQRPEIAAQFLKNQDDLIDNYPYMFARDGRMNMYGRSMPYRFAAVSPFGVLEYGHPDGANYGWLRMISTASLLQFLRNPDFMSDGVPTMGFYGIFDPAVQIYSCRGSVYWLGKSFFNLLLPEDSKYWSAKENRGPWDKDFISGNVYNKYQPSSNLLITDYPNCGGVEFRSWCKESKAKDWQRFRSSENYNKLAYHTEFPWMADGKDGEVSMNYATLNRQRTWEVLRLYDFRDFSDGIYRRSAVLESDTCVKWQLTDIPLPNGVLRVDKVSVAQPTSVRLGSYSLPDLGKGISHTSQKDAITIANGEYRLAVVPLSGWNATEIVTPKGLHPVSDTCGVVINTACVDSSKILVTLHLWKKGDRKFKSEELSIVKKLDISNDNSSVTVSLADGTQKTINFD